jgi:hypothetical protein
MRKSKVSYQGSNYIIRRRAFLFLVPLALALAFVLAACGSNGGTSTGAAPTATPTSKPTTVSAGTSEGCPNSAAVNPPQNKPNVTVVLKNSNSTITAHNGDLIEVRLPFGQQWSGPTISEGGLQLQNPAGYALSSDKVCIWRFVAQGSGTTQLMFSAKAICLKGQLCPQYILNVPFTIDVK